MQQQEPGVYSNLRIDEGIMTNNGLDSEALALENLHYVLLNYYYDYDAAHKVRKMIGILPVTGMLALKDIEFLVENLDKIKIYPNQYDLLESLIARFKKIYPADEV
jgi:hypothetical protein